MFSGNHYQNPNQITGQDLTFLGPGQNRGPDQSFGQNQGLGQIQEPKSWPGLGRV